MPVVCRAARRAAARGVRVVINIAPYAALPADVIALADPVIANEHEAVALAESGAVPGSLLVTYGANGTSWNGRTWSAQSVPRHQVLDTTGAGDAFCGVLAAALALGHDESHAMDAALAAGASAVRRVGPRPTRSCEPQAVRAPRSGRVHDEDDAIARDPGEHDRGLLTVPGAGADPQLPAQGSIIDAACALLDRQPGDASVAQPATQ